ncbi:CheY-like chemotaxis protein [Herbaspirillum sp. Sphag1AN]|uniref:response regulator n=1 Tax=unclassified Herbaspirillum TaxID=2624150 RepID=UPI00161CFC2B|nr:MULTISPECIES: response regulator [unclassified Herbaspirillum]MBB3212226.1 CheY-like chemotaxis protein [Herbaspirillum sp. Sphag1AN]MBB3245676.1 CheY-like chemotaxis protein [Herbaspirillum sp. Sphag64]
MSDQAHAGDVTILVVDDDEVDAMGIERALKLRGVTVPILRARDGVEGLAVLRAQDLLRHPCMMLLDINMPRMNGFEMLDVMHQDSTLASVEVFMLSTSRISDDRRAATARNVAGYIIKNDVSEGIARVIEMLNHPRRIVQSPSNPERN